MGGEKKSTTEEPIYEETNPWFDIIYFNSHLIQGWGSTHYLETQTTTNLINFLMKSMLIIYFNSHLIQGWGSTHLFGGSNHNQFDQFLDEINVDHLLEFSSNPGLEDSQLFVVGGGII